MMLSRCCRVTWAARILRTNTKFSKAFASSRGNFIGRETVNHSEPCLLGDPSSGCFSKYNLQHDIIEKLKNGGIYHLLEVQCRTFDSIHSGKDVCVQARTGTGKTLAYALPILQNVLGHKKLTQPAKKKYIPPAQRKKSNQKYSPLAVVLAPTRELAVQIHKEFESLKPSTSIKISCFYGGCSFNWQDAEVQAGIDVLVATPGRLLDHLLYRNISLKSLRHLVVDEADRMFDLGFQDQLSKILKTAFSFYTSKPQMLLFSATLPNSVIELAQPYMCDGDHGEAEHFDFVSGGVKSALSVEHIAVKCDWSNHGRVIRYLMKHYEGKRRKAIVFVSNKNRANTLASDPALEPIAGVIHSSLSQTTRQLTLKRFRESGIDCLIATDVASRGLDILDVDLIIQCEPPVDVDDFVHRAGRTGRVGQKGVNVLLFNKGQLSQLENIERNTGVQLRFETINCGSIVKSEAEDALELLDTVASRASQPFGTTAKSLIDKHGPENALAAALAVLAGRGLKSVSHSSLNADNDSEGSIDMDYDTEDRTVPGKSSLKCSKRRSKSKRSF